MMALVAGSDTTSSTLSHLFYFLLRDPDYEARIRAEIDATFPDGDGLYDFKRHADMVYLNACL